MRDPPLLVRRDWANLGGGPAGLIAELLLTNDVADYIRFRAVCRPWRLCSTSPRDRGVLEDRRFHPRHWIMLRRQQPKGATDPPHRRAFISVATGGCVHVDLPELRGHAVFGPTTEGLLVLLDRASPHVVRLLNPLTRQAADLPPATMLLSESNLERPDLTELLEISGAGLAGHDSTVAVHFGTIATVAVARPGDARWTVVERGTYLLPAMSFAGRFYCATSRAVMVVEIGADHPPRLAMVAKFTSPLSRMRIDTVHLVDVGGELLLLDRRRNATKHMVYRVDLEAERIVPVDGGLGGRAVFMGIHRAVSVSPSVSPSICADAIYMGFDDPLPSRRLGERLVHLMDGTTEARDVGHSGDDGMPRHGPRGVDEYLSWCVTGYCDDEGEH